MDDILCPTCGHSLGFHGYDFGSCQAPLGGLTSKNMCGCAVTIHGYIQKLEAKDSTKELEKKYQISIEKLEEQYKNCMDNLIRSRTVLALADKRIEFLELKFKTIRELLKEPMSFSEWFLMGYRREGIKMINTDVIILELEKEMLDG